MTSTSNNGPGEWFGEWMKLQQNYWDNWAQMTKKTSAFGNNTGPAAGFPDWSQGLEQWWSTVAPIMSPTPNDPMSDMMNRMMEMAKGFSRFAEHGYQNYQAEDGQEFISRWLKDMEDMFSGWIGQLSGENRANIPVYVKICSTPGTTLPTS